jgi:beta-galactosidase
VTWTTNETNLIRDYANCLKILNLGRIQSERSRLHIIFKPVIRANDSRNCFSVFREITHNDKDLLINGRPVNLRLTHDGGEFPLTGYPAMDVASWKKIIQTCKDYGLNGMRFHSWCPPEAAFEAADELGFYLQPECGLWADFGSPQMKQWLNDETARLLAAYGNHPSFILLSPSNEPRNYSRFTPQWAADNYAKDNRRLYSAGTGWSDPSQVNGGAQYASLVRFGGGDLRNTSGWFGGDYRDALETVHIPVLAHEVGQWCAYPDFDVIKKFTGYLKPSNYDIFKYIAEQEGVLDQDHAFAWASGRFQVRVLQGRDRGQPAHARPSGFQLLDLHDYLGQGTALIGVVDAFWEPKSYVTAAEFRRFAGPTVPLARLASRIYTSDQTLESDVEIITSVKTHRATNAVPQWQIVNSSGKAGRQRRWEARDIPIGKNIPLGKVSADLSKLAAPGAIQARRRIQMSEPHHIFENDWNFWLYPAQVDTATPSDVLVTHNWSEAATRLAAGGKVLFMPGAADLDPAKCPPMKNVPVFWNIQMTVRPPQNPTAEIRRHARPALRHQPSRARGISHRGELRLAVDAARQQRALGQSLQSPASLRPIVSAIDDWNRNWRLGVIFECNVGPGRLLVSAINLDNERGGSELQQLRRSLLDYMAGKNSSRRQRSRRSRPAAFGQMAQRAQSTEPARAFDPDLNDGTSPRGPSDF